MASVPSGGGGGAGPAAGAAGGAAPAEEKKEEKAEEGMLTILTRKRALLTIHREGGVRRRHGFRSFRLSNRLTLRCVCFRLAKMRCQSCWGKLCELCLFYGCHDEKVFTTFLGTSSGTYNSDSAIRRVSAINILGCDIYASDTHLAHHCIDNGSSMTINKSTKL